MRSSTLVLALAWVGAAAWLGCGARSPLGVPPPRDSASSAGGAGDGGDGGGGAGGAPTGGAGGTEIDAGQDGAGGVGGFPPILEEVYAHSGQALYRLDVDTYAMSLVGAFDGCGSAVLDIALDKAGQMYGAMGSGLARIDPLTAKCTLIGGGSYPNSLVVVPAGTVDPDKEALVGFLEAQYVRIDEATGALEVLGKLGKNGYASSGDMVVLPGGQAFLTVNGNGCGDCLVRVDPKTGELLEFVAKLDYGDVFGLASSKGDGFGFTSAGEAFRIDLPSGKTTPITLTGMPPGGGFFGAASRPADVP